MVQDMQFKTEIIHRQNDELILRGQRLTSLIAEADFVSTLFLSLTGRKPKNSEKKVLNAILVAAIDQGIEASSGFVPRVVAASGNEMLPSMASALLVLGPYHGGAISSCMELLLTANSLSDDKEKAAREIVVEYNEQKKRVPGFGHPIYKDEDPRTKQLFEIARASGLPLEFPSLAQMIELAVEDVLQRKHVLNIDGAIAALLLSMDLPPKVGNALFGLARVAGSISHIIEEQSTGEWVRRLPEGSVT